MKASRPNRGLKRPIQALLHCPLCQTGGLAPAQKSIDDFGRQQTTPADTPVDVKRYPSGRVTLECPQCLLRFSVPLNGPYGLRSVLEDLADSTRLRTQRPQHVLTDAALTLLETDLRAVGIEEVGDELDSAGLRAAVARLAEARSGTT